MAVDHLWHEQYIHHNAIITALTLHVQCIKSLCVVFTVFRTTSPTTQAMVYWLPLILCSKLQREKSMTMQSSGVSLQ